MELRTFITHGRKWSIMVNLNIPTQEMEETQWVTMGALYAAAQAAEEPIHIRVDSLKRNEERGCTSLFDEENETTHGTTVYDENWEGAEYQKKTPDGIRLLNAFGRFLGVEGETTSADVCNQTESRLPIIVTVTKTDKGWLWECMEA